MAPEPFMSFLNRTLPHFNVLTPRDFEVFAQSSVNENVYAIWAVAGISLGYLVLLFGVLLYDKLRSLRPAPVDNTPQKPRGKFRALLYDFSQAHLYVSFFYIGDRKHYTRTRRLACMYIAVVTCLAANAFSFSSDGSGWNLIKWAIASIVCNVLQAPFVGTFRWLFSSTAPRYPIEDERDTLRQLSSEFDQKMLQDEDNNSDGISIEEDNQPPPSQSRMSKLLDVCDELAGMVAKRFETKEVTWEALFSLFIISLFYFGICTVTLYLLPQYFSYITIFHQCVLGVIAFVFFFAHLEFLYLKLRLRKYKSGVLQEWRVGTQNIIMSCIMLGTILLLITFTSAMVHYLPFLIPFHTPLHSYVTASLFALTIVFFLRLIGLLLSIKMPGLKRDDPELEHKKAEKKYKFPWWFIYINYVLCFTFVGTMIFICLVYGIHFNARDQTWDWMMASWTGLSFYMFIRLPLTHLFMYIMYGTFVRTMETSLFPEEIDWSSFMRVNEPIDEPATDLGRRESIESGDSIENPEGGSGTSTSSIIAITIEEPEKKETEILSQEVSE